MSTHRATCRSCGAVVLGSLIPMESLLNQTDRVIHAPSHGCATASGLVRTDAAPRETPEAWVARMSLPENTGALLRHSRAANQRSQHLLNRADAALARADAALAALPHDAR